ncbi:unnamed protein product [Didymodactylos carnosus]|nr:unnamed protein product [Didymodactylos carnosus]CAF4168758.1 unnamed protein product [Didymodactylos carnosus]
MKFGTPLDDYVNAPDPYYKWNLIRQYQNKDYNAYILNLTSQKWLDETFSSRPIWQHYVSIVIPSNLIRTNTALLWVDNGNSGAA